ncbi:MAG: hypothetical protein QME05_02190 [Candidatus Margulisbacteria bacterium]|nr:hypothetical protein [Candidatus Margulisiibacteriota bacterium]
MASKHPGYALIMIIIISSLLLTLAGLFTKLVYNSLAGGNAVYLSAQAFYLAEAGIEKGKAELANNSNWYTDLPHGTEDDSDWLINSAIGQTNNLGGGTFKIIREQGKMLLCAVGSKGKGVCIQKVKFSIAPLRILNWGKI